ncbi:hypothetical protein Tco_0437507, partial [Tanacetum coccineum]
PQFEAEVALERQSEPDVPMFTRKELVAKHHAIKERVHIIENLADVDPSIVLQQLVAVKERIIAIETFLKYKNESVLEGSVSKHKEFVHKENESANGKVSCHHPIIL